MASILLTLCRSSLNASRLLLTAVFIWHAGTLAAQAQPLEILALSASSTSGMLMDAVDGDLATEWRNKHPGEREAWLSLRLKKFSPLRGLRLALGQPQPQTRVLVEVSSDGEQFTTVNTLNAEAVAGLKTFTFPQVMPAMYLRIRFQFVGTGSAPAFSIREIEPFGP